MSVKLTLDKQDEINLETRRADCNFCTGESKRCVKGALPFKAQFKVHMPRTTGKCVIDFYDLLQMKRKKLFYRFSEKELMQTSRFVDVVEGHETKEHTEQDFADICFDCVQQLYDLVKAYEKAEKKK